MTIDIKNAEAPDLQAYRAAVVKELIEGVGEPVFWRWQFDDGEWGPTGLSEHGCRNAVGVRTKGEPHAFYTAEQVAGAVAKAKAAVVQELIEGVGEPVATWLGVDWGAHRQCFAHLSRLDPGTDLYTAAQLAGGVAKAKQEAALDRLTEYQQLMEQNAKLREALEGVMDRLVDHNELDEAAVFARKALKETGQ